MDYSIAIEAGSGQYPEKVSLERLKIENEKTDKGLSSLKKGQLITGTVVAVDDQVTLNFNGQKVTASKSVLSDAVPGEMKTFEVVKATDSEIELKLIDGSPANRRTFKAEMVKDADWETILAQKSQAAVKAGKEGQLKEIIEKLEEISTKLTERDCRLLEEEGFPVEAFPVKGLYEAINRVKATAPQENQASSEKKPEAGETFDENALAQKLKDGNLPVTPENLTNISKAISISEAVPKMDDKAMQYLISREAEPTIENIYKACYSGTKHTMKLSEDTWKELQGQVKEVIKAAGYEADDENLKTAKWLIENKLPLTKETFTYKKELEDIKKSYNKASALDKILEGMQNGTTPKDVSLLEHKNFTAEQIIADIRSIEPEAVTEAVKNGTELTIKNLAAIQKGTSDAVPAKTEATNIGSLTSDINETKLSETQVSDPQKSDSDNQGTGNQESGSGNPDIRYDEIRARRQLEEIRLKMTLEAAGQLEKKGFKVETQELSKVVDALKELEDSYYKGLFKEADIEATQASLETLKETTQSIERLKFIPSYALGSTLSERNTQTIPGLLSEGSRLQAELAKAGTAYETLMTVPNSEYGDSIKKAFANMDSLLSELKIDNTEQNQRAVRILGYNQMEINEENLNQVKAYDLEVNSLIKNLHPAVTVRMIKEGYHPLDMPISELNRTIERLKEEQGITSEDKYSTYLRKLEKEDGITAEERKAYIGIYRLLYNIEKSDGAALGAVIRTDREVTLDHLLTAIQTSKKGRLDAVIDDEFGTLQSISRDKESIASQLGALTGGEEQQRDNQAEGQAAQDNATADKTQYISQVIKQMNEDISPEKLKELEKSLNQYSQGQAGQLADQSKASATQPTGSLAMQASHKGIWEMIKDVPVEKLSDLLKGTGAEQITEDEVYSQKVQQIRELCKTSEQAIRFLNDYQVPSTPMNIMIANHVLSNGESPIKKLFQLKKENIVEKSENSLKEMNDLSDILIDKHSMEETYNQLESDARAALTQSYSEEKIDSRKLAELKTLGQQMTFLRKLAEKEYYQIPIETDRGITNMNLTILRGTKDSGRVSVTVWSEQLGNVKAEFTLKDKMLKGFISSDSKSGLEQLHNNSAELEAAAAENGITLKQLDFGIQQKDNDTYSYKNPRAVDSGTRENAETERILYRVAKAVVRTVMSAENNGSKLDRAVS